MTKRERLIDPAGRPLNRPGYEAALALSLVFTWIVLVAFILWVTSFGKGMVGTGPSPWLFGIGILTWIGAEDVAGRRNLIWPGSALGIVGPLSVGFAAALATPDMRDAPFEVHIAIVSGVSAALMLCFLFRFRLPGLVSPVVTFSIVALFLTIYGTDPERLREVEGFSPRGIIAALLNQPLFASAFGILGLWAAFMARRLDIHGDDFGLASARPLHLIGCGVTALIAGRLMSMLPTPLDIVLLSSAFIAAAVWTMRINRVAVMVACHLAMAKPLMLSITQPLGIELSLEQWSSVILAIIVVDLAIWPFLHMYSQAKGWTLGPGGRIPPTDRKGWIWRYWPYAGQPASKEDHDEPDPARDRLRA
ncbi:MAG: hypothetical protein AAF415_19965 [Pseudomonadota bacterium]